MRLQPSPRKHELLRFRMVPKIIWSNRVAGDVRIRSEGPVNVSKYFRDAQGSLQDVLGI
jgi:hypothetical protein